MALSRGSSLEVVSEENFRQRRDGIASNDKCIDCIKERGGLLSSKESKKSRKRRKKEKLVRVNSPIVVRLRDTIKISDRGKLSSPKSSDTESASSTDTEDVVDAKRNSRNETLHVKAIKGSIRLKGDKNFAAFLSAIEQVHRKEHKGASQATLSNIYNENELLRKEGSLLMNSSGTAPLLNNLRDSSHLSHHCSTTTPSQSLRSIDVADNIKLVRNDLHGSTTTIPKQDSLDDSESSCTLSSDNQSDIESGSTSGDSEELSRDELEYLSNYTTGLPLTRYDYAPQDCPQCLSAYNSYTSCLSPSSVVSLQVLDDDTVTSSETVSSPSISSIGSESGSEPECVHQTKGDSNQSTSNIKNCTQSCSTYQIKQLSNDQVEVSLQNYYKDPASDCSPNDHSRIPNKQYKKAQLQRRNRYLNKKLEYTGAAFAYSHSPSRNYHSNYTNLYNNHYNNAYNQSMGYTSASQWIPFNTVFVDLTNSDVKVEVEYHSQDISRPSTGNSPKHGCSTNQTFHRSDRYLELSSAYHNSYPPTVGFFPYALPYYLTPPYYYLCPLMMSIPRPICVPRNTQCLSSQRMCLIPAHEIKSFTASQPNPRPWLPLASPELNRSVAIYTVMCYNVLCDMYCTRQLYGYCPSWALSWEYRKKTIIEEIRQYSADILSLQEVETEQFYSFFLPELKRDGYNGIFSPKSRAKTMSEADKKRVDGCAIFYKVSKFTLVKEHLIEFNQLAMSNAEGSHEMINRVMTKDNIGLCAVLETKETIWEHGVPQNPRQSVLIATCHIHWDPEFSDVKLIQTMMFINELKKIADENSTCLRPGGGGGNAASLPLILCGDLNSLPESGVVEFLNNSRVSCTHDDFKDIKYNEYLKKLDLDESKQVYTHGFRLHSAYDSSVMPFTNYTYDFKGVIDYIFYSRDVMKPLGVLGPLDAEWFRANKVMGCPHPHIPSDHLPLLVEIEMTPAMTSSSGRLSATTTSQSLTSSNSRPVYNRR